MVHAEEIPPSSEQFHSEQNDRFDHARAKLITPQEVRDAFEPITFEKQYLSAGKVVLQYLDKCFIAATNSENEDEERQEISNIMYVLRRLMKILSSDGNQSRHGGYAILCALLKKRPIFLPHVKSSIKLFYEGFENGIHSYVGHTLAYGALIESGCAEQDSVLVDLMLSQFFHSRRKASYMDPVVAQFIVKLLKSKDKNIATLIYRRMCVPLNEDVKALSITTLWVRLILSRPEYRQYLDAPTTFATNLYCCESYEFILMEIWRWHNEEINVTPFVKDLIESLVLHEGVKSGADNLIELYTLNVIPSYKKYESKNSQQQIFERFVFTLQLTELILPHLTKGYQVSAVMAGFLIRQIMRYCNSDDKQMKSYAYDFCELIALTIENNEDNGEVQLAYITQLITHPGTIRFDRVTGTGLIHASCQVLNADCIKGLTTLLRSNIKNDTYEVSEGLKGQLLFSGDFLMSSEYLSQFVHHPAMAESEHIVWRAEQVVYFLKNAFFRNHPAKERELLIRMYKKCLAASPKRLVEQVTFIDVIVDKIDKHLSKKTTICRLSMETLRGRSKLGEKIKKLKENHKEEKRYSVFRLLYGLLSLHLFIDSESTLDIISDIDDCYEEAFRDKKTKGKDPSLEGGFKNEEQWVKVFVDVMLLLLSKGDNYWRNVVNNIFKANCHLLGPSSLQLLTDVIDPDKEDEVFMKDEGEEEMMKDDVVDEDDSSDSDDDDEEDKDGESEKKDSESEESDDEDESDDDDDDEPETEEKLNLKVEMHKIVGLGELDIDMDDMSDGEMSNVNKSLGALITQYRKINKYKKPKLKIDKELLHQFRQRVCDLFDGLIREAPSLNHMLPLICPLLKVLDWSSKNQLQNMLRDRVKSTISSLCKMKEFKTEGDTDIKDITTNMENVFNICVKTPESINHELQMCYTFLVKHGLRTLGEKSDDTNNEVTRTYVTHLQRMLSKKKWLRHHMVLSGPLSLVSGSLLVSFKVLSELGFHPHCNSSALFLLLKTLWMNRNSLSRMPHSEVKTLQEETSKRIAEFFTIGCQDILCLNVRRTLAMFELVQEIFKFHFQCPEMTAGFNWPSVIESIKALFSYITADSHPGVFKKIRNLANIMKIELDGIKSKNDKAKSRKETLGAKRKRDDERMERREKKKKGKGDKVEEEEGDEDRIKNGDKNDGDEPERKKKKEEIAKMKKRQMQVQRKLRKVAIERRRVTVLKKRGDLETLESFSFSNFDNINVGSEDDES